MAPTLLPESLASSQVGTCFRRIKKRTKANVFPESYGVVSRGIIAFAILAVICLFLYHAATDSLGFLSFFSLNEYRSPKLEGILKAAAMKDKTVIITPLNEAWAAPNTVLDLYLESFRIGEETNWLLNHLVIVALDAKAYNRCLEVHKHCFALEGLDFGKEAYFMTPNYLEIVWKKLDLLRNVLQLGYNFVFSDADIMWFRDPFPQFNPNADFQISCDHYWGSSTHILNAPNTGFKFVRSNPRTIEFYKYWYSSREKYPDLHDQDVFNIIKSDAVVKGIGLKMEFLDTLYFGGLCELSRDMNLVCTMHANCCFGMDSKLHDIRIMLQDWKDFASLSPSLRKSSDVSWRVPQNCSLDALQGDDNPGKQE